VVRGGVGTGDDDDKIDDGGCKDWLDAAEMADTPLPVVSWL